MSALLVLLSSSSLSFEEKIYCVRSDVSDISAAGCHCQNYTDWSTMVSNSSDYFKSYTRICFSLDSFNLSKKLIISNVANISIIGINSTSIKCFNDSFLYISNATFVQIQNIELENCGANVHQYVKVQEACTALLLHNVGSAAILNVAFKSSYGHSIIGVNLMGSSVIQRVSVCYINDTSIVSKTAMGGIVLTFSDEMISENIYGKQQYVFIENCTIYYMHNIQASDQEKLSSDNTNELLNSMALEFDFHQQKYSVSILVVNTEIINVRTRSGPLIFISYNSSFTNNVTILNSNFSYNDISGYSITQIAINKYTEVCRNCTLNIFESRNCILSHNKARSIYYIKQESFYGNMQININVHLTLFTCNEATETFWMVQFLKDGSQITSILIEWCTFILNSGFNIQFRNAGKVTLLGKNLFTNNSVNTAKPNAVLKFSKTMLIFEGYNEFSFNTAYWILDLSNIILRECATINISQNIAVGGNIITALLYFKNNNINNNLSDCVFQFYPSKFKGSQNVTAYKNLSDCFAIYLYDNRNYTSLIYGAQLNSCVWLKDTINFGNLTTGDVMGRVLHFNNRTSEQVVYKKVPTICYCDSTTSADCIIDHFKAIFPGQTIPINLKQIPPYSKTSMYLVAQSLTQLYDIEQCQVKPYQLNLLQSIDNSCIPIAYKVYSNSHPADRCYVSFKTTYYPDDSLYIYYIDLKTNCPFGFILINGSCDCHPKLKAAFPTIKCDIDTQSIIRPGNSWVGLSAQGKILYVKLCVPTVCKIEPTSIHLNSSDTQCNFNRAGIACGKCPTKLSAVFGSLACKRCSNQCLLLIPVFLISGLFLILLLFTLNLTIVDGKINGFIMYVNAVVAHIQVISPSLSNIIEILMKVLNLDVGGEVCFYHGMTEYAKTWLQFAIPSYLLCIVAILAFASRYSSSVERHTRRRVISVIATIFLLSYSKLLALADKVLFSYTNVYSLPDNKKIVIWMWDSSIPLFGIKFSLLFVASLLVILFIIFPLTFLLLFTKHALRIRCIAKYLKPYLDAFQAPFKDNCRYFPGLELIFRWFSFASGLIFFKTYLHKLALETLLCLILLVYLCGFKPFRSLATNLLYISYTINVELMLILMIYSDGNIRNTYYIVILHVLIIIALTEFGATVLYNLYINQLQKIKKIKSLVTRLNSNILKCYMKLKVKPASSPTMNPVAEHEQLQEELLLADPAQ